MLRVLALVCLLETVAMADEPTVIKATTPDRPLALAINPPFRWAGADAIAVSAYYGFMQHFAIRANAATYDYTGSPLQIIGILGEGEADEGIYRGRIYDGGVAWLWFPRALYDGFMFETGLLVRARRQTAIDDFAPDYQVDTHTLTVGARSLIGWSWSIDRRLFVSIAVGASVGRESGTETTSDDPVFGRMPEKHDVVRTDWSPEGFMRFGAMFDL